MVKKSLLTKAQRQKRIGWCKKYKHWTKEQWAKVFSSDESKMSLTYHSGNTRVRHFSHEKQQGFTVMPTVKFPASIMIWSGFSARAIGYLHLCEKTVNGAEYKKILETRVLPYERRFFPDGGMVFQDDSAPAHRCKLVEQFKKSCDIVSLE